MAKRDVFINRIALALNGIGLILLPLIFVPDAYTHFYSGTTAFGAIFGYSNSDSSRFIVFVGLILIGGLLYSGRILGMVLSEMVALIVLWHIISWYATSHRFRSNADSWQYLDSAILAFSFLSIICLLIYIPYNLWRRLNHRPLSPRPTR